MWRSTSIDSARLVSPVSVCFRGCGVPSLRHGITMWQHCLVGQSAAATSDAMSQTTNHYISRPIVINSAEIDFLCKGSISGRTIPPPLPLLLIRCVNLFVHLKRRVFYHCYTQ